MEYYYYFCISLALNIFLIIAVIFFFRLSGSWMKIAIKANEDWEEIYNIQKDTVKGYEKLAKEYRKQQETHYSLIKEKVK